MESIKLVVSSDMFFHLLNDGHDCKGLKGQVCDISDPQLTSFPQEEIEVITKLSFAP